MERKAPLDKQTNVHNEIIDQKLAAKGIANLIDHYAKRGQLRKENLFELVIIHLQIKL